MNTFPLTPVNQRPRSSADATSRGANREKQDSKQICLSITWVHPRLGQGAHTSKGQIPSHLGFYFGRGGGVLIPCSIFLHLCVPHNLFTFRPFSRLSDIPTRPLFTPVPSVGSRMRDVRPQRGSDKSRGGRAVLRGKDPSDGGFALDPLRPARLCPHGKSPCPQTIDGTLGQRRSPWKQVLLWSTPSPSRNPIPSTQL